MLKISAKGGRCCTGVQRAGVRAVRVACATLERRQLHAGEHDAGKPRLSAAGEI